MSMTALLSVKVVTQQTGGHRCLEDGSYNDADASQIHIQRSGDRERPVNAHPGLRPSCQLLSSSLGCFAYPRETVRLNCKRRFVEDACASPWLLAGAAVDVKLLNSDETYARILAEQYNILVAEGAMKGKALRPAPEKYSFTDGDTLVAFAEHHKIKVRGHNFVWHEAIPDWFATTVTKENAKQFLVDHIMTVGGHYKNKIHSWDVVNEAVLPKDGRPDGLRNSPSMELLGP